MRTRGCTKAKEFGRNNFQFYSPEMNALIKEQFGMQTTLRKGSRQHSCCCITQSRSGSGQITGMEALLRYQGRANRLAMRQEFHPHCRGNRTDRAIGEWVMREACSFNKSLAGSRIAGDERGCLTVCAPPWRVMSCARTVELVLRDAGLARSFSRARVDREHVDARSGKRDRDAGATQALGVRLQYRRFWYGYSAWVCAPLRAITFIAQSVAERNYRPWTMDAASSPAEIRARMTGRP